MQTWQHPPIKNLRTFCAGLLLVCAATTCAWAQTSPSPATAANPLAAEIDATLSPYFAPNQPGATVIVTRNGKTLFRKAYGMANLEHGIALEPDMLLRLGSVTKQFTAAAILLLADHGKLSIADDITQYLPDYPTHGARISIENLLTHTSGIPNYTALSKFEEIAQRDMSVQQMLDFFKDRPLEFQPGERFAYSNSGYFVLGAIIEKVSGMRYADFMDKNIFQPLHLTHTQYDCTACIVPRRVQGYTRVQADYKNAVVISMTQPYAAGALLSNVDDLALWNDAIASKKLLKAETWQRMFTPFTLKNGTSTHYGFGWDIGKIRDADVVQHSGGIPGFATHVLRALNEDVFVAVLANNDEQNPSTISLTHNVAAIVLRK